MASSSPSEKTGREKAGSQEYLKRHYYEKLFAEGWSFSGFERDKAFLNKGDGTFLDVSGLSGADSPSDGRGAAFADFDNDGDPDIFVHTIQGERHLLFRNDAGRGRHLRVALVGTRSNRDAVGAMVTVTAGGRKLSRQRAAGSGYLSSHDERLLFGLGDARKARVDVRWPSGLTQTFDGVPAGSSIRIREGDAAYETVRERRFAFADPPPAPPPDAPFVARGDVFPDLPLAGLDGQATTLARVGDVSAARARLVNLWATWCVPCRKEMPVLERLAKRHAACLSVVGVSLDRDGAAPVRDFLAANGITYPVAIAGDEVPARLFPGEQVSLPTTFLVGADGRVLSVHVGGAADTVTALEAEVDALCRDSG